MATAIGVASATPGSRRTRGASVFGSDDAVSSPTPDWNMPSSAPPRLMRPAALRSIPELSASSTTIVATPIAMPSAVRTVRAA